MTTPRVDPFADLAGLANRIAQTLKANPKDAQARADLRYVQSKMAGMANTVSATDNPPEPPMGQQVRAGLSSVPGDVVRGVGTALMHPLQTLGQASGLANREAGRAAAHDPGLSIPEKLDALVRATPLNAGYAPFRAFLEATGMKSDEPAPLSEQVRQGGDIAAGLALSRVNPAKIPGVAIRALLRLPRWLEVRGVFQRTDQLVGKALGKGAAPETVTQVQEAVHRSYLQREGIPQAGIDKLIETWRAGGKLPPRPPDWGKLESGSPVEPPAPPTSRPGETITPIAPKGFAVTGARATPSAGPYPPSLSEMQGFNTTPRPSLGVGTRPVGLPQTTDELLAMEPNAVVNAAKALQRSEQGAAEEIFGAARAKQYEAAQRLVNSSTGHLRGTRYDEALKLIDQMEGNLSSAQEARLFGIGETGPNYDSVKELASHATDYASDVLADTPTAQLQANFSAFAGGERPTNDLLARYALPRLYRELASRGLSDAEIVTRTLARMGQRGISSETAGEALASRMQQWRQMSSASASTRGMPDIGTGKTLPYYPRGGMVEQTLAPPPPAQSAPHLAPNQNAAFAEFLKGATPEDLSARVGTLRALGVPLPPNAETELLAYLTGGGR